MTERTEGQVIGIHGNRLTVRTEGGTVECSLGGKVRREREQSARPAALGDRVAIRTGVGGEGVIDEVLERRTRLTRRHPQSAQREQVIVANADQALLVQCAGIPAWDGHLMDRALILAEAGGLDAIVCLNKIDLGVSADAEADLAHYARMGYRVLRASAAEGTGIGAVREVCRGKFSVCMGPSGVGKSSLINALVPGSALTVGAVSPAIELGTHTTTWFEMIDLPEGGALADTPGIESFGIWELGKQDVMGWFKEFRGLRCKYPDCSHAHEPGCAVKAAVESGKVPERRYRSYLRIIQGM